MIAHFRFPRPVWVLFAGTLVNRLGMFVLPFLALYMTRRGYSAAEAGIAVACYGAGAMIASLAGGHLADRIGRRRAIALAMFSAAASMLALMRADTFATIAIFTGLTGLTAELYRPAASALLVDLVEPAQRVTGFAVYRLAVNVGATIGPALGGFLAEHSFVYLFVGDAITCAAYGVIALVWLPEGGTEHHADAPRGRFTDVLRDRTFVLFLTASVAVGIVYAQMSSGFTLQVAAHGFSSAVYGGLIALNGFVVLLLELPLATVTRRLPPRPTIALGMLLIGLGFAATGLVSTVPLLALTVIVWTLGEIVSAPVGGAYVAALAPRHLIGRYQGAWSSTFALGWVIGPSLGGRLFEWNPAWLWGLCAVLGVVGAALVMAGERPAPQPVASSGSS